ncbi:MAG: transcriptional repressor [Anaerolineae bacterium]|nr:transcriptional repressor [Anaerolineae bacterium]
MTFQQQARDAIRDSGGRITPQREILFDLLAHVENDIDADALFRLAAQQDPNISLPTVYRTLNTLEDADVIAAQYVSTDHERKVYRVNNRKNVFHFTCRRCGKVTPVTSKLVDQLRRELGSQIGADVVTLCMCAGGLCEDCRKEESGL